MKPARRSAAALAAAALAAVLSAALLGGCAGADGETANDIPACAEEDALLQAADDAALLYIEYTLRIPAWGAAANPSEADEMFYELTRCPDAGPVSIGRLAGNALQWAESLRGMTAAEREAAAAEYDALADNMRGDPLFTLLKHMTRLGVNAPEAGETKTDKIRALRSRAHAGDLAAQIELAGRYERGAGAETNLRFAHFWFAKAAENGGGADAAAGKTRTWEVLPPAERIIVETMLDINVIPDGF